MESTPDISSVAKDNKLFLERYFYGGSSFLNKKLSSFQKHELNAFCLLMIETPIELRRFLKTPFYELESLINNPLYEYCAADYANATRYNRAGAGAIG